MNNVRNKQQPINVVIAGAGVAGLEAIIALRQLAGERVAMTLVSPDVDFSYRPLSVSEPFSLGSPVQIPIGRVVRDFNVSWRREALSTVDTEAHTVVDSAANELPYDKLIVAIGAGSVPAYRHVTTFRGQEDFEAVHGLVQDVEEGYARRVAFIVPPGVGWSLPIYELALMTAARAYDMGIDAELTVVTPEERPLAVFGGKASADVAQLLEEAGIEVICSGIAEVPYGGQVVVRPGERQIECDRIVALAISLGYRVLGLPSDPDGFIPIDGFARVTGVKDVYAVGDGANFPVKQGGIACQHADVAAEDIARAAGVPVEMRSFRPVLRGRLMTGAKPRFMRRDISGREGNPVASSDHFLWWPPTKVAGRYVAPYLALHENADPKTGLSKGLDEAGDVKLKGYAFAAR
jgi:sulfide:quinone oxidoreductase